MIGIFDSGVGGLTVYKELKKILPDAQFIYLADQKNVPYGIKSTKKIRQFTLKALKFLESKNAGCIVIACNTASVSGLDYYRKYIKVPIIGLVPAIKPAAKKYKKIAILSTPATSRSRELQEYIAQFSKNSQVKIIENSTLVSVVENADFESKEINSASNKIKTLSVEAVVLGCTHFVFLLPYFKKDLPDVEFFDSGSAVAIQTKKIYKQVGNKKTDIFYTTGSLTKFKSIIYSLLKLKVDVSALNLL